MGLAFRVAWQYRYLRGDERTIFMRHEGLPCRRGRPTRCFAARFAGRGRRRIGWRRSCIATLVITRTTQGHLEYWIAGEQNGTNEAYHAGLTHHTLDPHRIMANSLSHRWFLRTHARAAHASATIRKPRPPKRLAKCATRESYRDERTLMRK